MAQMPKFVAENRRCACPEYDCNYVTVDTIMLASHMQHLHPDTQGIYKCPHCPPELNVAVPFDEVEFHLRCHGELLFKVIFLSTKFSFVICGFYYKYSFIKSIVR